MAAYLKYVKIFQQNNTTIVIYIQVNLLQKFQKWMNIDEYLYILICGVSPGVCPGVPPGVPGAGVGNCPGASDGFIPGAKVGPPGIPGAGVG